MPVVQAHAMLCALGHDAAIACAAARAGLSRAAPVGTMSFTSDISGEAEPLIGHATPLLTSGFEGQARLHRLLDAGLRALHRQWPQGWPGLQAAALYLALPDPQRTASGLDLVADEEARTVEKERAEAAAEQTEPPQVVVDAWRHAVARAGWPGGLPDLRQVSFAGHAGGAACLARACSDLLSGRVSTAVVGAVDSLLDPATVSWLHNTGRLKLSGMPVGLMPGEAAVFLVLNPGIDEGELEVVAASLAQEPKTLLAGATSVGEGLAQALSQVAERARWKSAAPAWLIGDLNGEIYRANEWGHTVARLRSDWPALEQAELWLPALHLGDTGAASALVAVCTALHAFRRGYAPAETAVVMSSSETETRAAIALRAAAGRH
jgi:3-oxoacyl-[acyl-carrier-protein] synthase I